MMDTEAFCCYSSHKNTNKPAIDIVMFESKSSHGNSRHVGLYAPDTPSFADERGLEQV